MRTDAVYEKLHKITQHGTYEKPADKIRRYGSLRNSGFPQGETQPSAENYHSCIGMETAVLFSDTGKLHGRCKKISNLIFTPIKILHSIHFRTISKSLLKFYVTKFV